MSASRDRILLECQAINIMVVGTKHADMDIVKAINGITDTIYNDVADLGEEIIDHNPKAALKIIDDLIGKLKHLKQNLRRDEI